MKTKKTVIAVLTALLVISAVLTVSCIDQLEEIPVKQKAAEAAGTPESAEASDVYDGNYVIPAEKGVIKLIFSDTNARTILPDTTLSGFVFDIEIMSTDQTNNSANNWTRSKVAYSTLVSGGANETATLPVDTYTISVTAYNSILPSGAPVAGWNNGGSAFSVSSAETKTFNVALTAFGVVGSSTGIFSFNITPSPTTSSLTQLDILRYVSGSATSIGGVYPRTISASGATTETLTSGYYIVKVKATLANHQTYEYTNALHIFQSMTSTMTALVVPALIKNAFEVEYDLNGGDDSGNNYDDADSTENIEIVKYGNYAKGINNTNPIGSVNTFSGWFTNSTTQDNTTLWDLSSERVFIDQKLYAKWSSPGTPASGGFNITLTIAGDEFDDFTTDKTSFSRSALFGSAANAPTVTITVAKPATGDDWDSIYEWSISGTTISSPHLTNTIIPNDTLVINNSATFWELLGGSYIDVFVTVIKGGKTYASDNGIRITITN